MEHYSGIPNSISASFNPPPGYVLNISNDNAENIIPISVSEEHYTDYEIFINETIRNRVWTSDERGEYTLMCYNLLADCCYEATKQLYEYKPPELRTLSVRLKCMTEEIKYYSPDILCVQELDDGVEYFYNELQEYESVYKKRTNNTNDGCSILWKGSQFRLVERRDIEYFSFEIPLMDRNNIGILCLLQSINNPTHAVLVVTTHILFNYKRGDIQIGQILALLKSISHFKEEYSERYRISTLLTGDFNFSRNSCLHKFITDGELLGKHVPVYNIANRLHDLRNLDHKYILNNIRKNVVEEFRYRLKKSYNHMNSKTYLDLMSIGVSLDSGTYKIVRQYAEDVDESHYSIRSGLAFRNAYKDKKDWSFPTFFNGEQIGAVDHIFYEGGVEIVSVLRLPLLKEIIQYYHLSPYFPSDHISVLTSFNLRN